MTGGKMHILDNCSILVTGGTGSFGKAFIRYLLDHHNPKRVVVFSRDELKQFEMQQEFVSPAMRFFLGDVRDEKRIERALKDIDIVVHAAALKQVPAAEYNPIECIKTNVMGGENLINAAINAGVKKVLALSTDKAVNPMNLYGATKLCSDKLFVAANHLSDIDGTRFAIVRYGNVLGSRGSVVPFFRDRVKTGKLPITDPRMTRFFIKIEDGAKFVANCLDYMQGGEIFVPKIPSMRITDMATAICPDCEQEVVGIRPGEKLHEIMVPADEDRNTKEYKNFYIIQPCIVEWDYDYKKTYDGETGKPVPDGFEYTSDNNSEWMDAAALKKILNELM